MPFSTTGNKVDIIVSVGAGSRPKEGTPVRVKLHDIIIGGNYRGA